MWLDEWAPRFVGRRWKIAVVFDCDQAGRQAALLEGLVRKGDALAEARMRGL